MALHLDETTVRAVLGPRPDPAAVAALEAEIRDVVNQYEAEVAARFVETEVFLGPWPAGDDGRVRAGSPPYRDRGT